MTHMQIPIPLLVITVIIMALVLWRLFGGKREERNIFLEQSTDVRQTEKPSEKDGATDQDPWHKRWRNSASAYFAKNRATDGLPNWLWLTLGWSSPVIITGIVIGQWWWHKVFSLLGVALIIGWVIAGSMTAAGKPFRYKLAMWNIWLYVGVAALYLTFGYNVVPGVMGKWNQVVSRTVSASTSSTGLLPLNRQNEVLVRKFWKTSELTQEQADKMIGHARDESGFNQLRPDGSVYRVVPKNPDDDNTALCVMMVKESAHGDEAKDLKLDLTTQEGCLKFSLWLVKKRIAEGKRFDIDWDATSPSRIETFDAPTVGWSEEYAIPGQFSLTESGKVNVLLDGVKVIEDQPGESNQAGCPKKLQVQSREATEVHVVLTRSTTPCR